MEVFPNIDLKFLRSKGAKQYVTAQTLIHNYSQVRIMDEVCFGQKLRALFLPGNFNNDAPP